MSANQTKDLLRDPATWGVDRDGPDGETALATKLRSRARVTMPGARRIETPADEPAAAATLTATPPDADDVRVGDRTEFPTITSDEHIATAAGPETAVIERHDLNLAEVATTAAVASLKSRIRTIAWAGALTIVLLFGVGISAVANWQVGAGAALVLLALSGFVKAGVEHLAGSVIRQAPWWVALAAGFVGTFVLCSVGGPLFEAATAVGVFASLLSVALLYCYVRVRPLVAVIREEVEDA
jgi:hypothetical protein